jgi:hypothetical protein
MNLTQIWNNMSEVCAKCKLRKTVHSVHLKSRNEKLYFCHECVWRLQKMGYPDIKSFLDETKPSRWENHGIRMSKEELKDMFPDNPGASLGLKPTGHPWGDFLYYRLAAIKWLIEERGRNFTQTAFDLSMDTEQVRMIYDGIKKCETNTGQYEMDQKQRKPS